MQKVLRWYLREENIFFAFNSAMCPPTVVINKLFTIEVDVKSIADQSKHNFYINRMRKSGAVPSFSPQKLCQILCHTWLVYSSHLDPWQWRCRPALRPSYPPGLPWWFLRPVGRWAARLHPKRWPGRLSDRGMIPNRQSEGQRACLPLPPQRYVCAWSQSRAAERWKTKMTIWLKNTSCLQWYHCLVYYYYYYYYCSYIKLLFWSSTR